MLESSVSTQQVHHQMNTFVISINPFSLRKSHQLNPTPKSANRGEATRYVPDLVRRKTTFKQSIDTFRTFKTLFKFFSFSIKTSILSLTPIIIISGSRFVFLGPPGNFRYFIENPRVLISKSEYLTHSKANFFKTLRFHSGQTATY